MFRFIQCSGLFSVISELHIIKQTRCELINSIFNRFYLNFLKSHQPPLDDMLLSTATIQRNTHYGWNQQSMTMMFITMRDYSVGQHIHNHAKFNQMTPSSGHLIAYVLF